MRLAELTNVGGVHGGNLYRTDFEFDGCGGGELLLLSEILKAKRDGYPVAKVHDKTSTYIMRGSHQTSDFNGIPKLLKTLEQLDQTAVARVSTTGRNTTRLECDFKKMKEVIPYIDLEL